MHGCTGSSGGCLSIYSLGDAGFMRDILNGVAMIHGSGSFYQAAASALLFGFIIMMFKSLLNGAVRIAFGEIFLCWLLYMMLFIPKTTVVIEDLYSDRSYVVDNVPIGIAFPGHAISTIGYGFAEMMEQGFSTVYSAHGITREPFLESMYVINRLRDYELLTKIWEGLDVKIGAGSDSQSSWQNYMNDCLMTKYRFVKNTSAAKDAKISAEQVVKSFPSNVYGTVIYRDGRMEVTCSEAQTSLLRDLALLTAADFNQALTRGDGGASAAGYSERLEQALSLLGSAAADKMNVVKTALLMPLFDRAAEGYFQNADDVLTAVTAEQSISQRNAQWAMEQTLFMTTVKPFVTFFEAFVYAITPFAAILVCIGSFGIRLAVRYLQTLVWLQLWWPILSIINLYITRGAVQELSAALNSVPADSFYALDRSHRIIENWAATAGMLAASTPLIAFFVVSGSAYSFTTLTSRMQGSDHIDEKALAPDLLRQGTLLSNSAGSVKNSASGRIDAEREPQLATINLGRELSESRSSAFSRMQSEQNALNSSVQTAWGHALSSANASAAAENYSSMLSSSNTRAAAEIGSMADQIASGFNLSREQRNMVQAQIAQNYMASSSSSLNVAAKAAFGTPLGVSLDFSHSNSWTDSDSSGSNSSIGVSQGSGSRVSSVKTFGMGVNTSEQKMLQDSITRQTTGGNSKAVTDLFSRSDLETVTRQHQSLASQQQSYSETSLLSERFAGGFSLDEKEAADAVIGAGMGGSVLNACQNMSSAEKNLAKREEGRLLGLGVDHAHARIGGIIFAAAGSSAGSAGAAAVLNTLARSINGSAVSGNSGRNASLPGVQSGFSGGGLRSDVGAAINSAAADIGNSTAGLAGGLALSSASAGSAFSSTGKTIAGAGTAAGDLIASGISASHDASESQFDLQNIIGNGEQNYRIKSTAASAFSDIGGGGFMYLNSNYPQSVHEFNSVLKNAVNANPNLDPGMKQMLTSGSVGSASVLSGGRNLHTFSDGMGMSEKEKNYFDSRNIAYNSTHAEHIHNALQSFYKSAYRNNNAVAAARDIKVLEHL